MKTQWNEICENLQGRLDSGTYKVWVAPLVADQEGERLRLTAPNGFVATWVRDRLLSDIAAAAAEVSGKAIEVSVIAGAQPPRTAKTSRGTRASRPMPALVATESPQAAVPLSAPELRHTPSAAVQEQLSFPIYTPVHQDYNWRYGFDSFVVGPANNFAYVAAQDMISQSSPVDTLFLCSGPGLGKTHLTQAVGKALCTTCISSKPKVEYLTAEEFSTCFVQALRARDTERFKSRFRNIDLLLLEDIHFLQGKEKMQDEVLSTIKSLETRGGRVVLTSSFSPRDLKNVDDNLVSRFKMGHVAEIEKPDASTRRRILMEKACQSQTALPEPVADMLSSRLSGDIRQLEGCIHNLVLRAKMLGCTISVDMAQEILAQYAQDEETLDVDAIIRKVCAGFGLSPEQLASKSRKQNLVVARNTIFYLARRHTELSLQDIGDKFSRRHSTVLKGIAAVERELRRESPLGRQIAGALALIEGK